MALNKSKSRKCPVCVGCTPNKVAEIDAELAPLLQNFKELGEIPKAQDKRFGDVANRVGISPYSLRYHLKECLLDLEIQDQRLHELKDAAALLNTAKAEYLSNPSMANGTAYTSILNAFRGLAEDIEGQQDPEATVEYIAQTVLGPLARRTLAATSQEMRTLRDAITPLVSKNHATQVRAQTDNAVQRVAAALAQLLDDALKGVCAYYKVELEAQSRKHALANGTAIEPEDDEDAAALPVTSKPSKGKHSVH